MELIVKILNKSTPWFVLLAVLSLLAAVIWDYAHRPVTGFDIFVLLGMSASGATVVWGVFSLNAVFDRIERRAKEYDHH